MFQTTKLTYNLLRVAILLLAFALRIVALDQIPAGLSHDEAYNGITAMQVLAGDRRVFFEINKGIEPLIIYLEAVAFHFFGIGPLSLRLVNVLFGMLTVALIYPFTAQLFNRRVALLAMTGVAISFWAVFVSRLTLRAVLLPPLLLLTLYLFWRALMPVAGAIPERTRSKLLTFRSLPVSSLLLFILSGLTAGITMYSYLSSRFVPFIVTTVFVFRLIRRQITGIQWLGLLLHFLIWGIITVPLGNYFLENSESFSRRSNQVTTIPYLLNGEFEPMIRNSLRTVGMFTVQGDTTDRYNLDGRPVFDWANGLFFYLGFGVVIGCLFSLSGRVSAWFGRVYDPLGQAKWVGVPGSRERSVTKTGIAILLLATLFFMLLPDLITDDSPHFLRSIGAMPLIYIFWAVGVDFTAQRIGGWRWSHLLNGTDSAAQAQGHTSPQSEWPKGQGRPKRDARLSNFAVLLLVILTTLHTGYDYFYRWASAPEARYIYGADIAEISDYIKSTVGENLTVISAEYYRDLDPFRFTLHFEGHPPFVIWFDGRQTLAFPPLASGLSPRYVFPVSAPPSEFWTNFLRAVPQESGQDYELYRLPGEGWQQHLQEATIPLRVNVNNELILSGYQILGDVVSGGRFNVLLSWQALHALPPGTDYAFLVQMRDNQGHLWAQADGNGYAPADWQPGVQALQLLTVRLPGDLPPQTYNFSVEVVDRHTGQALPVTAGEATAAGGSAIQLTSVPSKLGGTPRPVNLDQVPNLIDAPVATSDLILRGYELDRQDLRIGDVLQITVHWQVSQQPLQDSHLRFFLVDELADLIYGWPAVDPVGGEWPTSRWPADYWVQDKLALPITSDVPAGTFGLYVLWEKSTDNLAFEDLRQLGYKLGTVKVVIP